MRISLLSNMFKKHSPKKPPGSKSPKPASETVKKEKKRKKSKDNVSKRLSLEDEDLSSELLSICKESNIDISKPSASPHKEESGGSVQLEDKIQEIQETASSGQTNDEGDNLTIDENQSAAGEEGEEKLEVKKEKKEKKEAKTAPAFSYIDPWMPPGWRVNIR